MEPARRAAPDVDQLAAQVTQLGSRQHLVVVPAMPLPNRGSGYLVLLDNDHLSAAGFCEMASAAGARLLYVQAADFDAGTDPDLDLGERHDCGEPDGAESDELAELRRDAESFNGRIRQLDLAFAAEGVLHFWAVTADWYDSLLDRAANLFPGEDLGTEPLTDTGA